MIAGLLTLAGWKQMLSGVTAQAFGIAVAVAVVIGAVWWLRHDARMDERTTWENRMDRARLAATLKASARARAAEAIGRQKAAELAVSLAASEAAKQEAEAKLEAMRARVIAYPKEIVEALNR